MEKDRLTRYFFIGIIVILLYFTFLIVKPFIGYIIMGIIITFLADPLYKKLNKKIKSRGLASAVMILTILLLIIIPTIFMTATLVEEAGNALSFLSKDSYEEISVYLSRMGIEGDVLNELARDLAGKMSGFFVQSASSLLGSLADIALGVSVMFFVMYYGFKEGDELYKSFRTHIPLKAQHRDKLLKEIRNVSKGVLYGQVMTSAIQGLLGTVGFLIFGIPNPVFWGFMMMIISFLPVVGTPLVWGPAGLIEIFVHDNLVGGIGLLIFGAVIIMNIDNFIKPKLISGKTQVHPVVVLVGVIGGLYVFGFAGIILGPLVVSLLITMIKFYTEEKSFVV